MALENPRFTESYERLLGRGTGIGNRADTFFRRFYEIFLDRPGVAALFTGTDMGRQVQMLKKSFYQLITFQMLNEPTPELERLVDLHERVGVNATLFDEWFAALLETVAELDPDHGEVTHLAWCWALAPGISYMKLRLRPRSEA